MGYRIYSKLFRKIRRNDNVYYKDEDKSVSVSVKEYKNRKTAEGIAKSRFENVMDGIHVEWWVAETNPWEKSVKEKCDALDLGVNNFDRKGWSEVVREVFGERALGFAAAYVAQLARENGTRYQDYRSNWGEISIRADLRNENAIKNALELCDKYDIVRVAKEKGHFVPVSFENSHESNTYRYSDIGEVVMSLCRDLHKTLQQNLYQGCVDILVDEKVVDESARVRYIMI